MGKLDWITLTGEGLGRDGIRGGLSAIGEKGLGAAGRQGVRRVRGECEGECEGRGVAGISYIRGVGEGLVGVQGRFRY